MNKLALLIKHGITDQASYKDIYSSLMQDAEYQLVISWWMAEQQIIDHWDEWTVSDLVARLCDEASCEDKLFEVLQRIEQEV